MNNLYPKFNIKEQIYKQVYNNNTGDVYAYIEMQSS